LFFGRFHAAENDILAADPNLAFPSTLAMVETKEAWMIVNGAAPNNFITTTAMVPTLSIDPTTNQVIADDATLRMVTVQLVAIHIVHTIGGHPEFIWSSFQHANATTGETDLAPSGPDLPGTAVPLTSRVSPRSMRVQAASDSGSIPGGPRRSSCFMARLLTGREGK